MCLFCSFNAQNIFYPHLYVRVCVSLGVSVCVCVCLWVYCVCVCVTVFHISDRTNETVFFFHPKIVFLQCENSIGKNSAQTDEEKQRERQRNERELKHAELEAQHLKV